MTTLLTPNNFGDEMTQPIQFDAFADEIINRCNGMLPKSVYRAIYETSLKAKPGTIVEVGAAHGAATIFLALGLKHSRREGKIITFEKVIGGSRERYGDAKTNEHIIRSNFSHFGVSTIIELHIGDVAEISIDIDDIAVLMLDADGAIDRDMSLFGDRMIDSCDIIIDDVDCKTRIKKKRISPIKISYIVDQKHKLTCGLLKLFQEHSIIGDGKIIGVNTWFGKKGRSPVGVLSVYNILQVYRQLTFSNVNQIDFPFYKFNRLIAKKCYSLVK